MTTALTTMRGGLLGLYAQTTVHLGAGTALGVVDLPVQRERHTHWPNAAGSSLKGILRDACREAIVRRDQLEDEPEPTDPGHSRRTKRDRANENEALKLAFGPPAGAASEAAGALSITDARLLAFPVRSLRGVFAWASCPMALERLKRDASLVHLAPTWTLPDFKASQALTGNACRCIIDDALVLEEIELTAVKAKETETVAAWIAHHLLPQTQGADSSNPYSHTVAHFAERFVILPDDWFTHFVRYATEVVARIGLSYETKTVRDGALFYQELLPAETLLYAVVLANAARVRFGTADAEAILKTLTDHLPTVLQVGGDETIGRGYCATRFTQAANGSRIPGGTP